LYDRKLEGWSIDLQNSHRGDIARSRKAALLIRDTTRFNEEHRKEFSISAERYLRVWKYRKPVMNRKEKTCVEKIQHAATCSHAITSANKDGLI